MLKAHFVDHFKARFPELIGGRVLVALSGGADSVALLHLLRSEELNLHLEAVHVHHGVRGVEADRDADFCKALCAVAAIPYHFLRLDSQTTTALGREATWRRNRYRALHDVAKDCDIEAIATGHHRDDIAEGVLMQLLRGGGPRALAGIAAETSSGVIRPLLPWARDEIVAWLTHADFSWREDSSNRDLDLLRNRVRQRVLVELERTSPAIRNHLVHLAETLASDENYFAGELRALDIWIEPWEPDGGVPLKSIADLPTALQTRWLHAQARRVGISRVTRAQLKLFQSMIADGTPAAVTLGQRWRLRPARGFLWLEPPQSPVAYSIDLQVGGPVELPFPGWTARLGPESDRPDDQLWRFRPPEGANLRLRSAFDSDLVMAGGTLVRARKMIARTLPRHLRAAWPLCCEDDKIHWIPRVWRGPENPSPAGHVVEVIRSGRPSCVV